MLERALIEWKRVLGEDYVRERDGELRGASTATFATHQRILAILRPTDREQVQECLRVATKFSVPIYPVSSGKNWGYGSRVPPAGDGVLLDLGRMNRIVAFDEKLAYVIIEPGVTQQQLFDYLRERKSRLWIDCTGSSPDCSLIGNAIERGFGHTPYGDHFANVCQFEVVLPNGTVLDTGMGRFPDAHAAPAYRWGVGPSLDGMFTQSNFGVITRMTIWLMPAPEYFQSFFLRCDQDAGLSPLIEALRPLRLNGTLRSAIHIGNDYKIIAGLRQYPWKECGDTTPLEPERMRQLRHEMNFGAWSGAGGLYGTRAQVREARRLLRRALKGKADSLLFLDDKRLEWVARFSRPFRMLTGWDIGKAIELVRPVYGLLQGIPTSQPLASTYWRKRNPPPVRPDPDRDGCGLLWHAPVAPASGNHAQALAAIASRILLRHAFEPMLSFTVITERALICVISLTYDRDVPGEDERAQACFDELQAELSAQGYPPYRLGIQSMGQMDLRGAYADMLKAAKHAVDPAGILAPGRYSGGP